MSPLTQDFQLAEQPLNFLLEDSELLADVVYVVRLSQLLDLSSRVGDREGAKTGRGSLQLMRVMLQTLCIVMRDSAAHFFEESRAILLVYVRQLVKQSAVSIEPLKSSR